MSLEAWETDQVYSNIVYLGCSIYPGIINHTVTKNGKLSRVEGDYCNYVKFTIKLDLAMA